jgi:hypothetical protein
MPAEDGFAIVPWGWLVTRAQEHDELISEAITWRAWKKEQDELLLQRKRELPDPAFGHDRK